LSYVGSRQRIIEIPAQVNYQRAKPAFCSVSKGRFVGWKVFAPLVLFWLVLPKNPHFGAQAGLCAYSGPKPVIEYLRA